MPITIYPGTVKKRNADGTYSDLIPGSDTFTSEMEEIEELQDIAGDGQLSGFTATDLTGAANELKNTLTQLAVQSPVVTSSNFSNPITCTGLTANHVVCNWGLFSDSACTTPLDPNNPPADITIVEGAGQYNLTIQNSSGTFYLKPTFILP